MVEGAPLLREYTSKAYRGFESHPLRHDPCFHCIIWIFSPLAITWLARFLLWICRPDSENPPVVILAGLLGAVVAVGNQIALAACTSIITINRPPDIVAAPTIVHMLAFTAAPFGCASATINIIIKIEAAKNTAIVKHRMAEIMKVSSVH